MTKLIEITGKALSGEWGTEDETGSGIPVLRTTNFTNEGVVDYDNVITRCITKKNIEDKYLRNGDIILEKSGGSDKQPVGRVVFFDGPEKTYLFNNFTGLLRVKNTSNWYPRYVFYSLLSNYLSGGTRKYENKTTGLHNLQADEYVSNFNVKDASLNTQKQICYQLDRVSNIIRQRNDEIASLDTLTKARFVEMFGDQKTNPLGWKQACIGDVCTLKSGTSLPIDKENEGGDIPYIKVGDMNYPGNERYIISSSRFVSRKTAGKGIFNIGSVIFPKRGGAIGTNKKRMTKVPICADLNIMGITPNGELIPEYLLSYFDMLDMRELADGSSVPQINNKNISPLKICVPSLIKQEEFAKIVKQIDKSKLLKSTIRFC